MANKTTPTKSVQGRETLKNADDFCRVCACSFKVQFGNNDKICTIATENLFIPSKKKECIGKATLAEMCNTMGIQVNKSEQLSSRVCRPCARKIRTANECLTFIHSRIESESLLPPKDFTNPTSSPVRFKRLLPTTVSTPERSPRPPKQTFAPKSRAKKSLTLSLEAQAETENNDNNMKSHSNGNEPIVSTSTDRHDIDEPVLSALNVEELVGKSSTEIKTVIVYPSGKIESRSKFDEEIKSLITSLSPGNIKAFSNMVFKAKILRQHLLESLKKSIGFEFKTYCQGKTESILNGTSPAEIVSFSNKILVHEAEVFCPFWMSCLHGACNSSRKGEKAQTKIINAMALSTAVAAKCRNQKMSAVAYRISTILLHSGVKFDDLNRLHKLGICMTPESVVCLEKKMGENCDSKVKFWKKEIEDNKASLMLLNETLDKQVCSSF